MSVKNQSSLSEIIRDVFFILSTNSLAHRPAYMAELFEVLTKKAKELEDRVQKSEVGSTSAENDLFNAAIRLLELSVENRPKNLQELCVRLERTIEESEKRCRVRIEIRSHVE